MRHLKETKGLAERLRVFNETAKAYADSILGHAEGSKLRNLDFKASESLPLSDEVLQASLCIIGEYNNFNPITVINILFDIDPDCKVLIARESSVALYVTPKQASIDMIKTAGKQALADEIDIEPSGAIRLWWD